MSESAAFSRGFGEQFHLAFFAVHFFRIRKLVLFGDDDRPHFRILAVEFNPFFHVRLGVRADRIRWALRFAHTTVDAFVRVDHQHVFTFVKTVHGANLDTVGVFAGNAVVVDDIGHDLISKLVSDLLGETDGSIKVKRGAITRFGLHVPPILLCGASFSLQPRVFGNMDLGRRHLVIQRLGLRRGAAACPKP